MMNTDTTFHRGPRDDPNDTLPILEDSSYECADRGRPTKRAKISHNTDATTDPMNTSSPPCSSSSTSKTKPRKTNPLITDLHRRIRQWCITPPSTPPSITTTSLTTDCSFSFTESGTWDDVVHLIIDAGFSSLTHPWTYRTLLNLSVTCTKFLHYTERFWWSYVRTNILTKRGNVQQYSTDRCTPLLCGNTTSTNPCVPLRFRREWLQTPHLYCTLCRALTLDCVNPTVHSKVRGVFLENKGGAGVWWWNKEDAINSETPSPHTPFLCHFPLLYQYEKKKPESPIKIQTWYQPPTMRELTRDIMYESIIEEIGRREQEDRKRSSSTSRGREWCAREENRTSYGLSSSSEEEEKRKRVNGGTKKKRRYKGKNMYESSEHLVSSRSILPQDVSGGNGGGGGSGNNNNNNIRRVEANVHWIWLVSRSL